MHSNFSGSTILVYGIILTAAMMTLVFEFSPYAFALLSIATFFILLINFLAIAEEKTEAEKKKQALDKIIRICYIMSCFLLLVLYVIGLNKRLKVVERFSRDVSESVEANIISMEEDTIFCFGTNDYYVVMQEKENGGYLKKKYPCDSTILFETETEPCVKITEVYEENILVVKDRMFLPIGKNLGENVEYRDLKDVQYEIYIPKGTLQELPSIDVQFN